MAEAREVEPTSQNKDETAVVTRTADVPPPQPTKTPMFQATHAARYQRQALIRKIEERQETALICFVSGNRASIDRDDTVFFVDLLHNVARGKNLDLILHTGGGDIDAAEKLITLIHTWVGSARLRVIVPDYAKSAGTLMSLGADLIVMSDTSELGPIDPQVILRDANGNAIPHSVQNHLDAYEGLVQAVNANPSDVAARLLLARFDPATVKLLEAVRDRARKFAETQLQTGMFRSRAGNSTDIAQQLLNTKRWSTHGQMIGWQAATEMGLTVDYCEPLSERWQAYWQLYCLQRLAVKDRDKLYESNCASLCAESSS